MIRRRKMLGIAPESPASGARFVGRFVLRQAHCLKKYQHKLDKFFIAQPFYFATAKD
jgi:hypothetical protein